MFYANKKIHKTRFRNTLPAASLHFYHKTYMVKSQMQTLLHCYHTDHISDLNWSNSTKKTYMLSREPDLSHILVTPLPSGTLNSPC